MLCDAQVHIWGADSPERPWPIVHGVPHRVLPYSADEVIEAMDGAGVDRAVIIPPSWEGDRNDLAVAAALAYPGRFGIMGRVNLHQHTGSDLDHWRETPGMLGIRLTFHQPEMRPWLTDGSAAWLWREAERVGLPVMMLAPGQTGEIAPIARRHPDLAIIVDHLNLSTQSTSADIGPAIEALLPLVKYENVVIKISALPCYTDEQFPFPRLQDHIRRVVNAFGSERCVWGSDMSRLPCAYKEWVSMFSPATGPLNAIEARNVGGLTLTRVLNWA